ncbi:MAG: hypothetical protein H7246_19555 [Phycisphaerae bacterium]|nr:hypothetical protein [Saprospiraceae bacterium]
MSNIQKSKVGTIAFGLKQAAALEYNHAHGEEEECNAPPVEIDFFHSQGIEFLMCESSRKVLNETNF